MYIQGKLYRGTRKKEEKRKSMVNESLLVCACESKRRRLRIELVPSPPLFRGLNREPVDQNLEEFTCEPPLNTVFCRMRKREIQLLYRFITCRERERV